MQDGARLYWVIILSLSNLLWLIFSAVKYGNPFTPIIELVRKVVKKH